jgi:hypothetical protein
MQVVAQILGEEQVPWEDPVQAKALLKRAGKLRAAILDLLKRDPAQRLSVNDLMHACSTALSITRTGSHG